MERGAVEYVRPPPDEVRGAVEYDRPPPDELRDGAEYDRLPPDELRVPAELDRLPPDELRGAAELDRLPPDELRGAAELDRLPPEELCPPPEYEDPELPRDEAPPPPLGPPASIGNDRTRRTEAKNAADETKALGRVVRPVGKGISGVAVMAASARPVSSLGRDSGANSPCHTAILLPLFGRPRGGTSQSLARTTDRMPRR